MKSKIVLCVLIVAMLASSLTSCFGSDSSDSNTDNSQSEAPDNRPINVYLPSKDDVDAETDGTTINIFTDGGTLNNADEAPDFKEMVTLVPLKEGYVFGGWYSDAELTNYINPNSPTKAQITKGTAYAKWVEVETKSYVLRENTEVSITDKGISKQQLDRIPISSDYKIKNLILSGYTKILVTVTVNVREVDDGYQYIFLYGDSSKPSSVESLMDVYDKYVFGNDEVDDSLLYMHKFDYGGNGKNKNWGDISFEVLIDTDRISDDLYLRYDASGMLGDDWKNKNVRVSITPTK